MKQTIKLYENIKIICDFEKIFTGTYHYLEPHYQYSFSSSKLCYNCIFALRIE